MAHPLFVYGTLHPDRAPRELRSTVALLRPLGPSTLRGRLHSLGAYPGVTLDGDEQIAGQLFALPADEASLWPTLDAYEGYSPDAPDESLFLRQVVEVSLPGGAKICAWVYLYNG